MKRRTFLIGVFGAFASLATGSLPTAATGQIPESAPPSDPSAPVAASDLDELEIDYMRRRRRRRRRRGRRRRRRYRLGAATAPAGVGRGGADVAGMAAARIDARGARSTPAALAEVRHR